MANEKVISSKALIDKFRQALNDQWGYIWGAAGVLWTAAKQKQKVNYMVANYGSGWKTDSAAKKDKYYGSAYYGSKWIDHYVADCSGLFAWAFRQLGGAIAHGSNSIYDRYCSSKGKLSGGARTDGKGLIPGTAVFTGTDKQKPHIGLYVGDGKVIEASGAKVGVIESKITDNKWKYWGELKGVDYSGETPEPAPAPEPEPAKRPIIRKGNRSQYVTELQTDLDKLGYNLGICGIDGDFGTATERAVKEFQRDHGLSQDGICGPKTWAALQEAVDKLKPEPAEERWTVTIPGLTREQAEELCKAWKDATSKKE